MQPSFSSSGQRTKPSVAASCSSIASPPSRSGFHAAIIQQQRPADFAPRRSCSSTVSPFHRVALVSMQPSFSSSGQRTWLSVAAAAVSPLRRIALVSVRAVSQYPAVAVEFRLSAVALCLPCSQ